MDIQNSCRTDKFIKMSSHRLTQYWIALTLVILVLVGCVSPAAEPTPIPSTATHTSIPPTPVPSTDTPTAMPPTATPTPVPPTKQPTEAFTLATSITEIVGAWQSPAKGLYFRFFEEGILNQAYSLDRVDTAPYSISEIWFEGTQMYLKEKSVSGVPPCGDDPAVYEVHLFSDGHIQIVKIRDKCSPRAGDTALKLDPVP